MGTNLLLLRRLLILVWAIVLLSWSFVYVLGFTSTSVDRVSYERGETKPVLGLTYWWPEKQGGYEPLPFQDRIQFTKDGRVLSPEEIVKYLNPELKPIVKDGKIYIHNPESFRWAHVYWMPSSPAVSMFTKARSYLPR